LSQPGAIPARQRWTSRCALFRNHASLIAHHPVAGVVRPWVDPDHSETIRLDGDQARVLLAAADAALAARYLRYVPPDRFLTNSAQLPYNFQVCR
jgi:hypothetical protein